MKVVQVRKAFDLVINEVEQPQTSCPNGCASENETSRYLWIGYAYIPWNKSPCDIATCSGT